jgi:hypothetical protein
MATEKPNVAEEPTTIEKPTTPAPAEIDTKALLDELGKIGVKKPEDLVNIHNASQQVGKAWNEVGTLRQQNEQLARSVQELQAIARKAQQTNQPDYGSNANEGVDLGKLIDTTIKKNIHDMQQQQFEAQRAVQREYAKITNDPDFQLVEEVWKKHAGSFDTQDRLQSGQSTLSEEYNNVVKTYYREIAKRSRSAIENLSKSGQKQPHMEAGETQSRPIPSGDQEHNKKVRQIADERSKGTLDSNRALENLVKEFFPADMFKIG